jgi:O-antigen/teichoic acid export membrane protein
MIDDVLRPYERFFHTDVRYLAKGTFWLTVGKVVGAAIAFGLSILYARYLPKELYGEYRYVLSVLSMLGVFALPGIATAIIRGVARGFDGTFSIGAKYIFFSSFGITVAGLAVATWFFLAGNTMLAWAFIAASIVIPFAEGLGNWRAYLEGKKLFRKKTLFNIWSNIWYGALLALSVGAIYFYSLPINYSLVILVLAYTVGHAIPNILFLLITLRSLPKDCISEPGSVRYGMHLSLIKAPATIANYLDAVLLHTLLGPAALALYAFAIALPEQIKGFLGVTASVAFPKLATKTDSLELSEMKKKLPGKIGRAMVISFAVIIIYIAVAPYIYEIFFPRYQDSVIYSQIFALSLITFPMGVFGTAIKAEGNLKKIYIHQLLAPIIQIIALIILIPQFALWGAVFARIIARIVGHGLAYGLFILK